jgi:hypothetical protein
MTPKRRASVPPEAQGSQTNATYYNQLTFPFDHSHGESQPAAVDNFPISESLRRDVITQREKFAYLLQRMPVVKDEPENQKMAIFAKRHFKLGNLMFENFVSQEKEPRSKRSRRTRPLPELTAP